jgi:ERCC4-related helicase
MLIDNKTSFEDNKPNTVYDLLKKYTEQGNLDLVTGFYTIGALAMLGKEINTPKQFRMILGNIMQEENTKINKIIDLLVSSSGIKETMLLADSARKAVAFLEQKKVLVKTIDKNFCHAKTYIYSDEDERLNFHITGSSNLTDAGLGMRKSSNLELNIAATGDNNDWKELSKWFNNQWNDVAKSEIVLPDKSEVDVKQNIIKLLQDIYKEYSPNELYYKVLYELFKKDIELYIGDSDFKQEIKRLENTHIYKSLYSFQQKGALSLIKMLKNYNGAILADAVGLGKTWTALAVMKYFQDKGYSVILLCPKKLRYNWEQYQPNKNSRFEQDDIVYYVRNHTDLQDERLDKYSGNDALSRESIRRKKKLLVVIDESHNLRNDKAGRYEYLVNEILLPEEPDRDVKVLQLSATPINNGMIDIRNQFKLVVKGKNDGFKESELQIDNLENIFRRAQIDFADWCRNDDRKIADLISKLSQKFFSLTDALVVARTRKMITNELGETMNFPKKEVPINEYVTPDCIGDLKSFNDILDALKIKMTAYRPSEYTAEKEVKRVVDDQKQREGFLVKMMYILLVKRLESSWFSFKKTVEKILAHHEEALSRVNKFMDNKTSISIEPDIDEDDREEMEETAEQNNIEPQLTLGKKNPISLSDIVNIGSFKTGIETDIAQFKKLKKHLDNFENNYNEGKDKDPKIEKLIEHIKSKQRTKNKKVLIFTVYAETAKFLYDELKKRKIENIAYVSGSRSETYDNYSGKDFEIILERFAPFTKLYNEKDWTEMYEKANLSDDDRKNCNRNVSFDKWKELVGEYDEKTSSKLNAPIDILIATDCLSEGQNLQDCDMVVNYDIHWNPVRLIQRMGRIDRLGSPNKCVKGINFWPAKDYEDYLKLTVRVENRMALMTVVGTETIDDLTPELEKTVENNPLLTKQSQKMLEQMQLTWDDIEENQETFGLNDLSLEQFRQDLYELLNKNKNDFDKIPNGVFSGFRQRADLPLPNVSDSIVAVLGYPAKPENADSNFSYKEIHLLHQNYKNGTIEPTLLQNYQEILNLLRHHKEEIRYVPKDIYDGKPEVLNQLSDAVKKWVTAQASPVAQKGIEGLFSGEVKPSSISSMTKKTEEKFIVDNFDLINWFVISK